MKVIIKEEVVLGHGGYHKERNYYCPKCDIYFPWDRRGAENKYCYNCGVELDWNDKKRMFCNTKERKVK